jgi:hypothetical protein
MKKLVAMLLVVMMFIVMLAAMALIMSHSY